ncbi:hypothetical protein Emed_000920 [Eimeria media]
MEPQETPPPVPTDTPDALRQLTALVLQLREGQAQLRDEENMVSRRLFWVGLTANVTSQWEHYGDLYHLYKLGVQGTPSDYRVLVERYLQSRMDIDFFRDVTLDAGSSFRYHMGSSRYWRGSYARESTPEAPKAQSRPASSGQAKTESRRGVKPEKPQADFHMNLKKQQRRLSESMDKVKDIVHWPEKLTNDTQQQSYSTYQQELLALLTALKKWEHLLRPAPAILAKLQERATCTGRQVRLSKRVADPLANPLLYELHHIDCDPPPERGPERRQPMTANSSSTPRQATPPIPSDLHPTTADLSDQQPISESSRTAQWIDALRACNNYAEVLRAAEQQSPEHATIAAQSPHPNSTYPSSMYRLCNDVLQVNINGGWRVVLPNQLSTSMDLLYRYQDHPMAGHIGFTKTYQQLTELDYWEGVKDLKPAGLLRSLAIPAKRWDSTSIYFVTGLPPSSKGNDGAMVVVDRLSKMAHFIPLTVSLTAADVASVLIREVVRLHEVPSAIVSDRDARFLSQFWKDFTSNVTSHDASVRPFTRGPTARLSATTKPWKGY